MGRLRGMTHLKAAWSGLGAGRLRWPTLLVTTSGLAWFFLVGVHLWSAAVWLLVALLVLVPRVQVLPLLAHSDKPEQWVEADNKARQTLAQVIGGFILLAGAYSAWNQLQNQRDQIAEQKRQFDAQANRQQQQSDEQRRQFQLQFDDQQRQLDEQRRQFQLQLRAAKDAQLSDRYARAVGQLGDGSLQLRLGAVFELERISRDAEERQWPILELLTGFVRERVPWTGRHGAQPDMTRRPPADVQAVLTVIGRNHWSSPTAPSRAEGLSAFRVNLAHTDLRGADLVDSRHLLPRAYLAGSHLEGADLKGAQMQGVELTDAWLDGARLSGAAMTGADLRNTSLRSTSLQRVRLDGARLEWADLRCADLGEGSTLARANLLRANMERVRAERLDLRNANMRKVLLTGAQIEADVSGAVFDVADLRNAFLRLRGWQAIRSISFANVHGLNGPAGFADWALQQKAVSFAEGRDWPATHASGAPPSPDSAPCEGWTFWWTPWEPW